MVKFYLLKFVVIVFLIFQTIALWSQQIVGLFQNDSTAFNGYTLIAPLLNSETYLMHNCGYVVNTWSSNYWSGISTYFLPNGNLLRTGNASNPLFNGGGIGGIIELKNWNESACQKV